MISLALLPLTNTALFSVGLKALNNNLILKFMENSNDNLSTQPTLNKGGVMARFFSHKHKWQVRGRNRYGGETYRICLKCRETYQRVNNSWEDERWEQCEPIHDLDAQFDSNDSFIFK